LIILFFFSSPPSLFLSIGCLVIIHQIPSIIHQFFVLYLVKEDGNVKKGGEEESQVNKASNLGIVEVFSFQIGSVPDYNSGKGASS